MCKEYRYPYPVTLFYQQEFTQGLLKGVCREGQQLGFVTVKGARQWVEEVNKNNEAGQCDYKVTAFSIKF